MSFSGTFGFVFRSMGWARFLTVVLPLVVLSPLTAQLKWETNLVRSDLELGQPRASASFPFQNVGSYPVTIRNTSSSCGCTTASLEKTVYYPGEKGEIVLKFEVGNRTGVRRNTARIFMDDPTNPHVDLVFEANIPVLVTMTPRLVAWRVGDEPETKEVKVTIHPEAPFKFRDVLSPGGLFETTVKEEVKGLTYRVLITPRQTNSPQREILSLQTEPKQQNSNNFSFYAFIR